MVVRVNDDHVLLHENDLNVDVEILKKGDVGLNVTLKKVTGMVAVELPEHPPPLFDMPNNGAAKLGFNHPPSSHGLFCGVTQPSGGAPVTGFSDLFDFIFRRLRW